MTLKTSYLPAFLPSKTFYLPASKNFFLKKLDNACAILYLCKQF